MRRIAFALLLAVVACAQPPAMIQVGDDTWMVQVPGADPSCPAYRLQSPTQMTVQALFFRKRDGTFTMNRLEACGP
jgi:hypothetical protein